MNKRKMFSEERNWSIDEMTPEERDVAARLCEDLFDELAVDNANVLDVIQTATEIWPSGTEVNGQPVASLDGDTGVVIQDYPEDRRLALDEIEWVRIEGYSGKDEMDYDGQAILYVYLPIKNGKVDKQEVSFDFYPDKNTDNYYDSVGYVDVVAKHGNEMKSRFNENKKIFKEGAGAGYDVGISELKIDKVIEVKELEDGDYAFTATIKPGFYEISAEDYYNDFFWQEHEFGDTPEAKIDGGVIHGTICPWEDTDDPERWVSYQVQGSTLNISFMYGGGWSHANLPEDGQLYIDEHIEINPEPNFSVDDIQLDAIDLVQAVNAGYASLDDRYNDDEEEDEGEPMNESSDDEDLNWHEVTDAFEEFEQRLWSFTKQDIKGRRDAFSRCTNSMEKALREYYNEVVYDGAD